jgi:hypothetical protein
MFNFKNLIGTSTVYLLATGVAGAGGGGGLCQSVMLSFIVVQLLQ